MLSLPSLIHNRSNQVLTKFFSPALEHPRCVKHLVFYILQKIIEPATIFCKNILRLIDRAAKTTMKANYSVHQVAVVESTEQ